MDNDSTEGQDSAGRASSARIVNELLRRPVAILCIIVLIAIGFVALFAPLIATHDPNRIDPTALSQPPSSEHIFGTDQLGRDLFSRVVFGARVSVTVSVIACAVGAILGLAVGVFSAYLGGRFDLMVQRLIDVLLAFPTIILGLMVVAALGPSIPNVIAAIALIVFPQTVRIVRSEAMSVSQNAYIEAAASMGAGFSRITFLHIVPNVLAPWIVVSSFLLGRAVILEATLSFLGAGVQPPTPSWGGMLRGEALLAFESAPWIALFPGLAIVILVFAVNLLGDEFRDASDPRLSA